MKLSRLTLPLAALLPLLAQAHNTSTSGTATHAVQHGALTVGYITAAALAAFSLAQWLRRARNSK